MSTTTTNYGLIKPELTDVADITAINENWDKIDNEFKNQSENITSQINSHNTDTSAHEDIRNTLTNEVVVLKGGTVIPNNSDLDTYLTVGNYKCVASGGPATLLNCPTKDAFHMVVGNAALIASNYKFQEITDVNGDVYWRYTKDTGKTWTDWRHHFDDSMIIPVENGGTGVGTIEEARQKLNFIGRNPIASSEEDTPSFWKSKGTGVFNMSVSRLEGQPTQNGFVESYVYDSLVHQVWHTQQKGGAQTIYTRAGNTTDGWYASGWTKVFDSAQTIPVESGGTGATTAEAALTKLGAAPSKDHQLESYTSFSQINLDSTDDMVEDDALANFITIWTALGKPSVLTVSSINRSSNLGKSLHSKLTADGFYHGNSYMDLYCLRTSNMLQIDVYLQYHSSSHLPANRYSCVLRYTAPNADSAGVQYLSPFVLTRSLNGFYGPDNKPTPAELGAAESSHGTHVTYSETAPVMDGTASVGSASTVARSDHAHPTDTSRAAASDLASHTSNKSNPHGVTAAQLGAVPTSRTVNGKALSGNISLTANDVSALPLGGGEVTGDLTIKGNDNALFIEDTDSGGHAKIYKNAGSSADYGLCMYDYGADGSHAAITVRNDVGKAFFVSRKGADGAVSQYELFHRGHKPTGTYTGNGSSAERTITIGGIGNLLLVRCTTGFALVTHGAIIRSGDGYASEVNLAGASFSNGTLELATTHSNLNANGKTYTYYVL